MTTLNTCKEQSCSTQIRKDHYLCRAHWEDSQKGTIDECSQCGMYKDAKYPFCIACNKKANAAVKKKPKPAEDKRRSRKYDPVRTETFAERAALLEDDPKAEDKRLLFSRQQDKCVYCGNKYGYDELQIEHMIPKARGGQDHLRNSQLACRSCNQAKGTMTDIEFREKHASYLPQKQRTPANPPIDPALLRTPASAPAQNRRFWRFQRK